MARWDDYPLSEMKASPSSALLGITRTPDTPESWRQLFPEVIGRSSSLLQVLETAYKVARSESSVLILGESGTGKELIAAAIHRLSARADRPYVPLNCSAIPENLLESDLFGHERGAFTGADRRRSGKFEYAEGGTIFLDEIGDMALTLQAKLLRVLQDKKFAPVGGNELKEVNVRIVAATNKDLAQAVKRGEFRLDLYYRLNVLPIHIPALRDRPDDIPYLIEYFTEITNRTHINHDPCYLAEDLIQQFSHLAWPGNIRQLQNTIERLFVMKGGGTIGSRDVPPDLWKQLAADLGIEYPQPQGDYAHLRPREQTNQFSSGVKSTSSSLTLPTLQKELFLPEKFGQLPQDGINLQEFIEGLENSLILQALDRTGQNRNQAAKLLGLNRTTLVERIKKRRLATLNDPSKEL
jgi:sigma-54 specific flagellar transcriptional regulator A